jgi:hypothetical protein
MSGIDSKNLSIADASDLARLGPTRVASPCGEAVPTATNPTRAGSRRRTTRPQSSSRRGRDARLGPRCS